MDLKKGKRVITRPPRSEAYKKYMRDWQKKHRQKPEVKERQRVWGFKYRAINREIISKRKRDYYEKNKEKIRKRLKEVRNTDCLLYTSPSPRD